MAPKVALRRLLPHPRGIRSSSSKVHGSISAGRVTRSIQDTTNRFHASPAFTSNITKVTELPGLFRRNLTLSLLKCAEGTPGAYKTKVVAYSDDVKDTRDDLGEDISRTVQQPNDNGFLATLRYSCDLANAALSASPSIQCALIEQVMRIPRVGKDSNFHCEVFGVLSRRDLKPSTKNVPSFTLRFETSVDRGAATIGPRTTLSGKVARPLPGKLGIELRFRPNALAFIAPRGGSADEPTHGVDEFVRELLTGLWHSLRGRQFTSVVSWNEAVVLHLKDSFRRSKFDKYLELEDMRVSRKEFLSQNHTLRWVHEPPCLEESLHGFSFGPVVGSKVLKLRHMRSSEGVENKPAPMPSARKVSNEKVKTVINPYTLDISVASNARANFTPSAIASRIEQDLSRSTARDLPIMLDSFLAVLQNLPTNLADPMTVRISLDAPTLSRSHASNSLLPADSVELKKGTASDSVKVSIRTDLQRSFQLRFNSEGWEARQIQVKSVLFQISPIDATVVDSLLDNSLSEQVDIEQETNNLATNAATIIQKVCEGVKFDDVTTTTGYLAEAVLRVVRPLTPGFVLDSVSIEVVIGDDLVTLTKTVSVADLEARIRAPKAYIPPLDHVELPSGYQATVCHKVIGLPSKNVVNGGFTHMSMQLLSHPVIDYEPANIHQQYRKAIDIFNYGLKASRNIDCYDLQAIVCNALKKLPGGDGMAVNLTAPGSSTPAEMSVPTLCDITVFSDGEITIELEPLVLTSLTYDRPRECKSVHAVVEVTLKGTPNQQVNGRINARQQIAFMHKVLASKCTAYFDGYVLVHRQLAAEKFAEIVLEARSELEDHFAINTVSVRFNICSNDQTHVGPAGEYEAQYEAESSLSSPARSIDHTRVAKSAGAASVCKDAVAIKALLQELDFKLLSITSTPSDDATASDEIARPVQLDSKANRRGQMQRGVVVALGSNVGNRVEEIEKACRAIDADPDMRIVDTSFLYETKPMYVEDQERFVNGACEIETSLTPIELLDRLQAIEQGHGRVKLIDKGPRNIDLDIAIFRDEIVETERLTVPHLLMHEREFVLRPIMDLRFMRQWRNPRSKKSLPGMFGKVINPQLVDKDSTESMHAVTPLTTGVMMYPMDPCRKTLVMSILNTTPDSFSDGESNTLDPLSLRETAAAHIAAGATIIDVGGQSSRPNAPDVTAEEEINRVLPAIAAIKSLPEAEGIAISVDTYRAAVAEAAVNAGAHIVNDISAGALDPQMLSTVARLGCTYVMMHMRGTPATMQSPENCTYDNLRMTIRKELESRIVLAKEAGVRNWRIILDPGIGFAKTQDQNLDLLRVPFLIPRFISKSSKLFSSSTPSEKYLARIPQLVGCSRKGFIGNITGVAEPKHRIFGTAAAVTASIRGGADIVRVHDVQEMVQVARMADAIYRGKKNTC